MPEPNQERVDHEAQDSRRALLREAARRWCDGLLAAQLSNGRIIAVALLLALGFLRLEDGDWLKTARHQVFDLYQQVSPRSFATERVAIVDIDEASLQSLGQWPWPRSQLSELVTRLLDAGALSIGFDVVFAEPDRLSPPRYARSLPLPAEVSESLGDLPDNDLLFAESLRGAPVALGMSGSTASATAEATPLKASNVVEFRGDPRPFLFGFPSLLRNIATLESAADGHGLFSLTPEHDGVVRRIPAVMKVGEQLYPSLGLEVLRLASRAAHIGLLRNESGSGIEAVRIRNVEIPTDRNGLIWLRFSPHLPSLYIPAMDVLGAAFKPETVRDRMVLVGTSAAGLRDLRMTPLQETVPGVELHAQLIDSILSGDYLRRPGFALALELLVAGAAGLLLIWIVPRVNALRSLPLFIALTAGLWGSSYLAYSLAGIALDPSFGFACALLVFGVLLYCSYSRAEAQRRQIRSAFQHYLSPDLVGQLVDNPKALQLGGESREMTFLFCDIAGFTAFTEQSDPQVLVRLLNEYLDGVCKIVMDHGGTIDKIVGDAVHAFFNAPLDQPDHAARAASCALAIDAFARAFSAAKAREGLSFGETRIGVNTGPAIVGNFGGSSRFDFTAHGDSINTAARLEAANKMLGTRICIAESTVRLCPDLRFRPIGILQLKGKEEPVKAFEPLLDPETATAALPDYDSAFSLLEAEDPVAGERFKDLAARFPSDPLIALHSRRLAEGATGAAISLAGL